MLLLIRARLILKSFGIMLRAKQSSEKISDIAYKTDSGEDRLTSRDDDEKATILCNFFSGVYT